MSAIESIADRLTAVLESRSAESCVAGAVVGVSIGAQDVSLAHGVANLNTGQVFTTDTGFLLGSVTKVLTTTLLLRLVERGAVDLDVSATRYVPEFSLRDPDAARHINVRMLVNHTNGIDAGFLAPDGVRGRDASRSYVTYLTGRDVLFEPGRFVSYSNPGFVLAARIIEEVTGLAFERAIAQELFGPCGMVDATAVQTDAFLRRTAIGAFADIESRTVRPTRLFSMPESNAGAGSTPIVTVADMLAFGRMHLAGGTAPNGQRLLSRESVSMMQTPTFDTGLVTPPIGLGWWAYQMAGTTAFWHAGGSPGGASSFCILPEYDAVIVSFVTGGAGAGGGDGLNDLLHGVVIEELTGQLVTPPFEFAPARLHDGIVGEYASAEVRAKVDKRDDELLMTSVFQPYDMDEAEVIAGYMGRRLPWPEPVAYRSVSPGLFAPAGVDISALGGFLGRHLLLASVPAGPGHRAGLQRGTVYIPRAG
jgi:CubicO group peptidase (beta-lactamase class C family)